MLFNPPRHVARQVHLQRKEEKSDDEDACDVIVSGLGDQTLKWIRRRRSKTTTG